MWCQTVLLCDWAAVHVSPQGYNPPLVCGLDILRSDRKRTAGTASSKPAQKEKGNCKEKRKERKENHAQCKAYKPLVQTNK